MIRIGELQSGPLAELHYMNARSGGGSEVSRLELVRANVGPLADELDAIVCCSDLQGVVRGELLGVAVAEWLVELAEEGVLPPSPRTGIVLAGDLYSVPAANRRGGYGDVSTVWAAFAERFPWVVGVAGNHDDMTDVDGLGEHVHVLDGRVVVVDGIRIGGVGYICGNKQKPGRRAEDEQLQRIAAAIESGSVPLTVCGHCHWRAPLAQLERGQVLNVDARVIALVASRERS